MMRAATVAAMTLLAASCMIVPPPPAPPPPPTEEIEPIAAATHEAVNDERVRAGLRPYAWNARIAALASSYAEELAERRELEHTSPRPGRETLDARFIGADIPFRRGGENLAQVHGTAAAVPYRAVQLWLRSPGHRALMLSPDFTRTGIGVARDNMGAWYVTQLFVDPL